jgi:hypothetical protein
MATTTIIDTTEITTIVIIALMLSFPMDKLNISLIYDPSANINQIYIVFHLRTI